MYLRTALALALTLCAIPAFSQEMPNTEPTSAPATTEPTTKVSSMQQIETGGETEFPLPGAGRLKTKIDPKKGTVTILQVGVFDAKGELRNYLVVDEKYPRTTEQLEKLIQKTTEHLKPYGVPAPQVQSALPLLQELKQRLTLVESANQRQDQELEELRQNQKTNKEENDERYRELEKKYKKLEDLVLDYMSRPPYPVSNTQLASISGWFKDVNFDTRELSPKNGFVAISGTVFCAFTSFLVMSYVSLERKRDKKRQGRAKEHEVDQAEESHKRMTVTFWMGVIFAVALFGLQYIIH